MDGYGGFWFGETLRDYAPNSVLRILSGKAIRRALRGDFLADAAYNIKLLFPIFPSCKNFKEPTTENIEDETLLVKTWFFFKQFTLINEVKELEDLCAGTLAEDDLEKLKRVEGSYVSSKIMSVLVSTQDELSSRSRTSKIWVRKMLTTYFIRAKRMDWLNHSAATKMMLNLDNATGCHNYVISACLYLQMTDKWNILGFSNSTQSMVIIQHSKLIKLGLDCGQTL